MAAAQLVAPAQLVPAAGVAPVVASLADRRSPVVLLAGGYLVQAAAMAGTAAAVIAGAPVAAYVAAVAAATAVTTTRPAQSALLPSVAATPDQLTAANVVVGWLEAAGVAAAGLLAGVLISLAGVGSVFVVCASLGLVAGLLIAGLQVAALAPAEQGAALVVAGVGEGLRLAASQPRLRLMLTLLTADAVVVRWTCWLSSWPSAYLAAPRRGPVTSRSVSASERCWRLPGARSLSAGAWAGRSWVRR